MGTRLHQPRQDRLPQMVERNLVAEEQRLVGGHRLDHLDDERFVGLLHLGTPVQEQRPPERLPVDQVIEFLE